jgi:hypothetical protein
MTRFHAHDLAPDLAPTSPRIKARSYDLTSPPERFSVRHTLPRRGEVMSEQMPTWLRDHLIAEGHISEAGLTKKARLTRCRCGAQTIAGIDADGVDVYLAPIQINALGEAMALVDQRGTWEMRGHRLIRRHRFSIRARPAGTDATRPTFAAHRCGAVIPNDWRAPIAPPPISLQGNADTEEIPL